MIPSLLADMLLLLLLRLALSTLADLPPLPANITPVKLVSDFLRCLYNEIMLPTLQDNYGHR